jgi:DNA repair protein RadD
MLTLRPYQQDAIDAFFAHVKLKEYSGIISAPTGSGKSAILADICKTLLTLWDNTKIIVCTHRYELIEQDRQELLRHYPEADTGIYSSGLSSRNTKNRVIFAGIQSITTKGFLFGKVDLLIIDEAHKVNSEDGTSYARLIQDLKTTNPNIVILGLSASPYRLDSGLLYEGEGRLFDTLYYEIDIVRLINDGYLCPVVSKGGVDKIDLSDVRTTAGDYNTKDLEVAADSTILTRRAVDEMIAYGHDRKSWMVFTTSIQHALHVSDEITARGIVNHVVTSESPQEERDLTLQQFKAGNLRCIVNVNILTEGFNAPQTDMVVLLMATKSPSKFVQAVGRGMRVCEGKRDCLVLDFGGNTERLGTIDNIQPPKKSRSRKDGTGEAPAKECLKCHSILPISVRTCPECGHEFPAPAPHDPSAYDGEMIQSEPEWIEVEDVMFSRHHGKNGKTDTLRVDYLTDISFRPISQWICLDHPRDSFPYKKAIEFVTALGGYATSIDEALKEYAYTWKLPTRIKAQRDGKFWRVLGIDVPIDAKPKKEIPDTKDWMLSKFC